MTTALLSLVAVCVMDTPAVAATNGHARRWPWRNNEFRKLTQVNGHTYASPSARRAIDIAMKYEAVYSIGPGAVLRTANSRKAGNYLQMQAPDDSVITYEHLSSFVAHAGDLVYIGDHVAVSGNTGNSTGPHLHLQRSRTASFQSEALPLPPINGVKSPSTGVSYRSENAAIGTTSAGVRHHPIRTAYRAYGGTSTIGVPQAMASTGYPCWTVGRQQSRWMYRCEDGWVQTYQRGTANAIVASNRDIGFVVSHGFEAALVARHPSGSENITLIGFPRSHRYENGSFATQAFDNGYMTRYEGSCYVSVWVNGESSRAYKVC